MDADALSRDSLAGSFLKLLGIYVGFTWSSTLTMVRL